MFLFYPKFISVKLDIKFEQNQNIYSYRRRIQDKNIPLRKHKH